MIPWLLLLCASVPLVASAAPPKTLGVPPHLVSKYVPSKAGTWTCLDGSKDIPWDFVNDDSCDCPDGSDEPASMLRWFDELPGVCPNTCKEIGEEYQKKRKAELKLRKTGSKIRSTYIAFAHQEKKRLQTEVDKLADEIKVKEKEVQRLQDIADRTESLSQAALEHKQQSPLYQNLIEHHNALKSLQREYKNHLEREKALGLILDTLRTGYNPNYQDMAVLEAVRGWEELAGLPHINDGAEAPKVEGEGEGTQQQGGEKLEEGEWSAEELTHDEHIQAPQEGSILFDVEAYLPDSVVPAYEDFKSSLVNLLQKVGLYRGSDSSGADSSRAWQVYYDAKNELDRLTKDKETKENDIKEIFNVHGFGERGEWKKLDGHCLELDTGDYTYEVCLFDEIKQKPNNGGTTFSLGKFKRWNKDAEPGSPEFYSKQVYKKGTRCWNGPERNTKLLLSCGTENKVLTVQELEKCEYEITATTPALCLPVEEDEKKSGKGREEL
ncbi:glucosidase II beta subunit-like protein-domain-containing protein [Gymnopilus junonius]|uniref:Glucosidase 2 subunit beta n=1 Tax=Gymnopilus junonius TaxID=109634 RepID=A0A9P5NN02_GYMJU|nr:glucosidase II beta subunit-like protein-domain-containing protein [Gymnopilus junonius]